MKKGKEERENSTITTSGPDVQLSCTTFPRSLVHFPTPTQ